VTGCDGYRAWFPHSLSAEGLHGLARCMWQQSTCGYNLHTHVLTTPRQPPSKLQQTSSDQTSCVLWEGQAKSEASRLAVMLRASSLQEVPNKVGA
jgi:hypothetical protein